MSDPRPSLLPAPFLASRARRALRPMAACAWLVTLCASAPPSAAQTHVEIDPVLLTAPYDVLDNVGGEWVNLATYPVRPMLYDPEGRLWVVNHHDSTIERFTGVNPTPDRIYGVPWSPVSIAWWQGDGSHPAELLVVCRGNWVVVGLDPATGAPTRLLQLRPGAALPGGLDARIGRMAEPGDILVDDVHERAFVSCMGADSVVQIDLSANQIVRVFNEQADAGFRLKSPLHLSWDFDGESVLCAPLHSGNNSFATGGLIASTLVEDFGGLTAPDQGLPDEDLFRIRPYVDASNPGSTEVVLTGVGTILFGHGLHPATNDFWQLNTEAVNQDPNKQTEPAVQGIFARNRVSIVTNTGTTWGSSAVPIGLDPGDFAGQITTANTVGQPVALAFSPAGYGFIAGLLTDNVLVLDQNGNYAMEWNLPDGAIPRALLQHPTSNKAMLVYCWGDNTVRAYVVDPAAGTASLRVTFHLHHDPTPADVAEGRRVFFDASHSAEQNLSCATCHIDGGNDFLMWNLSNGPQEEKGPMFTQTLVGLQRLAPFHWRGERQLQDFKPAFVGLLGARPDDGNGTAEAGEEPSAEQFARFQDFVFSLVNPANPNQNRTRVVDPSIHHPDTTFDGPGEDPTAHDSSLVGDAIQGQQEFQEPALVNVGRHSCLDCHGFPTGTNNDINVEQESAARPRRGSMKPAPFHEGWRKRQSMVRVVKGTSTEYRAFLGSGFSHLGAFDDLFRFVDVVTDNLSMTLIDDQKANDITDFIHQWDQGLAPAVHFAYLLDAAAAPTTTSAELAVYLQGEMQKQNCDIAVLGTAKGAAGTLVPRRWSWSRTAAAYLCEDPTFATRQLADFSAGATNDGESNVFLGLPLGMAERFAIDYDMDGVRNLAATEIGHEYDPSLPGFDDGQSPGFAAGGQPQILWESTKTARLVFTTSEPTKASIDYQEPKTALQQALSPRLARHHSVLLTGLRPSTDPIDGTDVTEYAAESVTYTVTITLEDATGNSVGQLPLQFATQPFIVPDELEQGGPGTEDPAEKRNQRSHVVQEICLGGPNCDQLTLVGGQWRAQVDLAVAFKRGEWTIPSGSTRFQNVRAANRAVIGRVLVERASGTVETATAAGLAVTPVSASAILADEVKFISGGNQSLLGGVPEPKGQFLAGLDVTDANGDTAIVFDVNPISVNGPTGDLVSGDRIVFHVEGVVEIDAAAMPSIDTSAAPALVTYLTNYRGTFMQWSFPDTKEARSAVRSAPIP